MNLRARLVLAYLVFVLLPARYVLAQTEAPDDAVAIERVAPSIVSVPPIVAPATIEEAPSSIECLAIVEASGIAQIESCDSEDAWLLEEARAAIGAAVFRPAQIVRAGQLNGEAVRARIRLQIPVLRVGDLLQPPNVETIDFDWNENSTTEPIIVAPEEVPLDSGVYEAVARAAPTPAGAIHLSQAEMREIPGSLGDPFRAIDVLPGVTPILSGLPYFYLRGAPPIGVSFMLDDIPVPTLFHFGLGSAVIHPRMVESVDVFAGIAPAQYGRHVGGVVAGSVTPLASIDRSIGEIELRAIDLGLFVQHRFDRNVAIQAAARIGYPGFLLSIFAPNVGLQYWDYQLRGEVRTSARESLEIFALGSYDTLSTPSTIYSETTDCDRYDVDGYCPQNTRTVDTGPTLTFHRLELRHRLRAGPFTMLTAFRIGYEESSLRNQSGTTSVQATNIGPRTVITYRLLPQLEVRVGGGIYASFGGLSSLNQSDLPADGDFTLAFNRGRSQAEGYVQASWDPRDDLHFDLGMRVDVWMSGSNEQVGIGPRLRGTHKLNENFSLLLALGIAEQPTVFPIPLPGLSEVPLSNGLQRGYQGEAGLRYQDAENLEVSAKGFLHRYEGLLVPDLRALALSACSMLPGSFESVCTQPFNGKNGQLAYGMEVFGRASINIASDGQAPNKFHFIVSYTLQEVIADAMNGFQYTPSFDLRHIANLAAQWEPSSEWIVGIRAHFRTGGVISNFDLVPSTGGFSRPQLYEQRMPAFFRVDASVAHRWDAGWAKLRLGLEWFNVFVQNEAIGLECNGNSRPCDVQFAPAIFAPNLYLRGSFE